jgi:putative nucleotidyltransferase with HDIG domain
MDPALSAELLRVANSALYGFVQRIDSVNHAVVILGSENVKRLALTVSLAKFVGGFLRQDCLRTCWDHVIASAVLAEQLAQELHLSKDRAYTAALLHDIGRLALLISYPDQYANLLATASQQNGDLLEGERRLFDIDHCATGRWLAQHWNLPPDFAAAISDHHQEGTVRGALTPLVRAACQLADVLGFSAFPASSTKTIAETLSGLPLPDLDRAAADVEASREFIRHAVRTIDPSGRA